MVYKSTNSNYTVPDRNSRDCDPIRFKPHNDSLITSKCNASNWTR